MGKQFFARALRIADVKMEIKPCGEECEEKNQESKSQLFGFRHVCCQSDLVIAYLRYSRIPQGFSRRRMREKSSSGPIARKCCGFPSAGCEDIPNDVVENRDVTAHGRSPSKSPV